MPIFHCLFFFLFHLTAWYPWYNRSSSSLLLQFQRSWLSSAGAVSSIPPFGKWWQLYWPWIPLLGISFLLSQALINRHTPARCSWKMRNGDPGGRGGETLLGGFLLCPRLPNRDGSRGQVPGKGHQSYICWCLVYKRPGPKYAVSSGSYKLSRYLLVKIITGCCSYYCDYRVLLSCTHTHHTSSL